MTNIEIDDLRRSFLLIVEIFNYKYCVYKHIFVYPYRAGRVYLKWIPTSSSRWTRTATGSRTWPASRHRSRRADAAAAGPASRRPTNCCTHRVSRSGRTAGRRAWHWSETQWSNTPIDRKKKKKHDKNKKTIFFFTVIIVFYYHFSVIVIIVIITIIIIATHDAVAASVELRSFARELVRTRPIRFDERLSCRSLDRVTVFRSVLCSCCFHVKEVCFLNIIFEVNRPLIHSVDVVNDSRWKLSYFRHENRTPTFYHVHFDQLRRENYSEQNCREKYYAELSQISYGCVMAVMSTKTEVIGIHAEKF